MKHSFFFLSVTLCLLLSCQQKKEPTKPVKTTKVITKQTSDSITLTQKKKKPKIKYVYKRPKNTLIFDSISTKNAADFFLEYGKKNPETKLKLTTRLGTMYITLYNSTPIHRASFIYLVKHGYYNTTVFHRVVKDFIIQGGNSDLEINSQYRNETNNYRLPPEFNKQAIHKRGSLSSSRRWKNNPDKLSNPYEFYIMQTNEDCSHLNYEHTVFGEVTKGFSVIDKIANQKTDGNSEWPQHEVWLNFEILD